MNSQGDPEMGVELAGGKLGSRSPWRRRWLVIGSLLGVSGTLTIVLHHAVERAQEAAARAN
jgi:hypothetical protein